MTEILPVKPKRDYRTTLAVTTENKWQQLGTITVGEAIERWLGSLQSELTRKNYTSGIKKLVERQILVPGMNLQAFSLLNHEAALDAIKRVQAWSEATRQARAALYASFTRYLERQTQGFIRHAIPSRQGENKTFYKIRDEAATRAMNRQQWTAFLTALEAINLRDTLIAKLMLQGGKRISEVLSLTTDGIDFDARTIRYDQAKTRGMIRCTVITHRQEIMDTLREYLGDRTGLVFITRNGKPVHATQLSRTFAQAGEKAGVQFKVTPHVLRATTVTYLKREGFSDTDIMNVTGHASSEMVRMYDRGRQHNASAKVNLV